jgi:peptide/nickel transport system substrate-binding protein
VRKKNKFVFLLLLSFVLVLSACGQAEQTTDQGESQNASQDESQEASQESSDVDTSSKTTLFVGLDDEPPQLDPHRSSAAVDRQTFQSLYNKLVDIDGDLNIIPELAKSWEILDGGKTYVFELEEGVVFHDGEPFNAEAVKFNFERMLDPDMASPRFSEVKLIEEVNVLGEYTVEIKLKDVFSPFLSVLTDRAGMMVSPKAVKELGDDFANQPVGTGPFKFVERIQQSHIKLERFDEYWREKPAIETVMIKPFPDANVRVTNLVSGELDIVNKIAFKDLKALQENPDITVLEKGTLGYQGIHLNTRKAPFDNKKVRQAINYAIDRKAIAKVVFYDGVIPAVSGISPASWAYTDSLKVPERDAEKARALLQESGVSDLSFTLMITPKPEEEQMAQMIQAMLGDVGFTVEIEMIEFGTMLEKLRASDFDAIRLGWSGRTDPDGNLYRFYYTGSTNNYTGYSNPEVDALLDQARTEIDVDTRIEQYEQINEILWNDVPFVNLYHEKDFKAMKKYVKGFKHIADTMIRTESIYFE